LSITNSDKNILFVHNAGTTFVHIDLECLRNAFSVDEYYLPSPRLNPLEIWRKVKNHDLVFGWFASWHTFLPILFAHYLKKPSLLVIGGYDLANLPAGGYGHQRGGVKKYPSRWTMKNTTRLVTNSYYSQGEAETNAGIPKRRVQVIYHGVPDPFGELPPIPGQTIVLTVGNVERENLLRKGHEPFVRAAQYLPKAEFVLVGKWKDDTVDYLRSIATANVTFTGWVDQDTWLDYYRRAWVYVQPSLHEGFGMSVAEAMLAGCVPVVSQAGALPEVVGEDGFYTPSLEPKVLAETIQRALAAPPEMRQAARGRILEHFPLHKRCQAINDLVGELL